MLFLYVYLALGLIVPIVLYTTNAIIIYRSYMREPKEIAPYAWIELSNNEIKYENFSDEFDNPILSIFLAIPFWWFLLVIQLKTYYEAYKTSNNHTSLSLLERFAQYRHRKLYPEQHI